ncbi:hypothetical protein L3i20_v204480 [Paenibacillus sp. L3-i20]|nr:hypothetical protein L3i20_v204480 [Paenibacillus sp. L3-i20]
MIMITNQFNLNTKIAVFSEVKNYVEFIQAKSIEQNIITILNSVSNLPSTNTYSLDFFENVIDWMRKNRP